MKEGYIGRSGNSGAQLQEMHAVNKGKTAEGASLILFLVSRPSTAI
jgi:hypothetical protein